MDGRIHRRKQREIERGETAQQRPGRKGRRRKKDMENDVKRREDK